MTGEPYEQMLRDADPYRPGTAHGLDETPDDLLEHIVSEPAGRRKPYRLAVVGVAAAVLAAAVAVPIVWTGTPEPGSPPAAPSASARSAPAPSASSPPGPLLEPAKVRKAAEQGPRLLLGEPGWKIIHLEPYGERLGEMAYEKDGRGLTLTWSPTSQYGDRRANRTTGRERVTVGGIDGYLAAFGKNDFDVVTVPRDGVFAELRSGTGWSRADFRALVAGVRHVDVPTWITSVTPLITRSGEAGDRAARLLMEMSTPPHLDTASLEEIPADDIRQFDTTLVKLVVCGWLTAWQRAEASGDDGALNEARLALRGSERWTVLEELEQQGSDLRRSVTTMADRMVTGKADAAEIQSYRTAMC